MPYSSLVQSNSQVSDAIRVCVLSSGFLMGALKWSNNYSLKMLKSPAEVAEAAGGNYRVTRGAVTTSNSEWVAVSCDHVLCFYF